VVAITGANAANTAIVAAAAAAEIGKLNFIISNYCSLCAG